MIEILYPDQEWPISLPKEDDLLLDRMLEARREGKAVRRWRHNDKWWRRTDRPGGLAYPFQEIIAECIKHDWTLMSMPPIDAPTPTRAVVMAALEHESFCRWPDHGVCCGATVLDCTCNVNDNTRIMERMGWVQVTDE